jgi:hypothetical protein
MVSARTSLSLVLWGTLGTGSEVWMLKVRRVLYSQISEIFVSKSVNVGCI